MYIVSHKNLIEQGDICHNLPKFVPSNLISDEESESTWDNYIESIKKKESPSVKFSIYPSPTWGVVLTQSCDIENAKEGDYILFGELIPYEDYEDIEGLPSNNKKVGYLDKIIEVVRNEPAQHYFPELEIDEYEKYGPWTLLFRKIFFASTDLIKNNKDLFWKARLISPAIDILKEKINRFFTRLAFEECIFLSNTENEYYISLKRKKFEEKIRKFRKDCGFTC